MNELRLISKHIDSVKPVIEEALSEALRPTEEPAFIELQHLQDIEQ